MDNVSKINLNGWPIDGSYRSQTQYNLFAGYLAEGFRASAARSAPADASIFGVFFAILNLAACISAGFLLLIWVIFSSLFRLVFKSKESDEVVDEKVQPKVDTDYSPEMLDWLLSDEYAELYEARKINNK
jgi:hypothetical protein